MSVFAVPAYRSVLAAYPRPMLIPTVSPLAERFERRFPRYEVVHFGDGDGLSVRMKFVGLLAVLGIGFVLGNGRCASKIAEKDSSAVGIVMDPPDSYTSPSTYSGAAPKSSTQTDEAQQLRNLRHTTDKPPGAYQDQAGRKFYVVTANEPKADVAKALGLSVEAFDSIYNDQPNQPWAGYAYPVGDGSVGK